MTSLSFNLRRRLVAKLFAESPPSALVDDKPVRDAPRSSSLRGVVITVSDSRSAGGHDASGDVVEGRLRELPCTSVARQRVPDDIDAIREAVAAALEDAQIVVLTGGTGVAPRDVTPQAVAPLLDYEVAGMAEAMRAAGLRTTPHAMLSRQVVGVARQTLVMALPGSPRAAGESLDAVWSALPHALELLRGRSDHP